MNRNEQKWKIYVKPPHEEFFKLIERNLCYDAVNAIAVEYSKIGYFTKVKADK